MGTEGGLFHDRCSSTDQLLTRSDGVFSDQHQILGKTNFNLFSHQNH